ncbi:MAG: hypothetical protein ACM3NQ_21730 [Bacteroidales bacterium]
MTPPTMNVARTLADLFLRGNVATAFVHSKILPPTRGAGVAIDDTFLLYKTGERWMIVGFVTHAGQYEGETDGKTLDLMGVRPGMTIGEIGAGERHGEDRTDDDLREHRLHVGGQRHGHRCQERAGRQDPWLPRASQRYGGLR